MHTPDNHIHIINFGGSISVNGLYRQDKDLYYREVREIESSLPRLPEGVSRFEYAACLWSIEHIRQGGGLAVYCHPHWLSNVYHVRDSMTRAVLEDVSSMLLSWRAAKASRKI